MFRTPSAYHTSKQPAVEALPALVPGYEGKRYGMCSDGLWHLVMKIYADGMTDTLCAVDVTVVQPQPTNDISIMCDECVEIHLGKKR